MTEQRTIQEMTEIRKEFQQTDLDRETQRYWIYISEVRQDVILTGTEIMQLRPITSDAEFNQHLRVFGENYS